MARRCTSCERKKAAVRKTLSPKPAVSTKVTSLKPRGSKISMNTRLMSLIKKGE